MRGLNPAKQVSCRDYFVRLQFVRLSGNGKFPLESRSSAALAAHLQQTLQNTLPIDMVVTGTLVNDRSIPPGMNAPPVDAAEEDFSIIRCENVDIQPLVEYCTSHNFVSLLEMRCAVSLNGQDYSTMPTAPAITAKPAVAAPAGDGAGPTKSSAETVPHASDSSTKAAFSGTLLYNFQPSTVKPCCASLVHLLSKLPASSAGIFSSSSGSSRRSSSENDRMEQLQRVTAAELTVLGSSFLPAARLPRGYVIEGRLQPQLHQAVVVSGGSAVIVDDAIDPKKDLLGIDVAVKCDTVNKLSVSISLAQLVVLQRIVEDLCCTVSSRHRGEESEADMESNSSVEVAHLPCKISFFLKTLPGGTEERLLHSAASEDPLVLNLYSGQQQCIVPSCTRHPHANPSRYAMILKGSGFRFFSSDMRVFLHLPRGGSGGAAAGSGDVSWHPPIQLPESAARMLPILRRREHSKPGQVAAAEDDDDDAAHTAVMQNEMESSKARGKSVDVISLPEQYWIEVNLQPLPTYLPQLLQEYQKIEGGRASDGGSAAISPDDACFSPSAVCLSVSLDGGVVEASEAWAKLFFHSSLAAYTFESPAPKGGFTAGASVALLLEEYCPAVDLTDVEPIISSESVEDGEEAIAVTEMGMDSDASKTPDDDQNRAHNAEHVRCGDAKNMPTPPRPHSCIVRIRGAPSAEMPEGAAVACTARLEEAVGDGGATADEMEDKATKTRFTFTIPPGVSATPGMLPGRTQGKEKFFFVDVSMDGGKKFDLCEAPLLALK